MVNFEEFVQWNHERHNKGDRFSMISPKFLTAADAKNIHIVNHSCTTGTPNIKSDTKTLCGENLKSDAKTHLSYKCKTEQAIRVKAAEKQENDQVCGRCVARLYADDK